MDKFVRSRIDHTNRTKSFIDTIIVVDRMHIKGHVDACREEYHPDLYEHLNDVGTSINETRNSWISRFSPIVGHMNSMRYYMFFYIIFDEFNTILSNGHINICDSFKVIKNLFGKK